MRDDPPPPARLAAGPAEMLWLLGQPHLSDYLGFVRDNVVGGDRLDPRALTDEWRAANEIYYDLEETERGIADTVECLPLDPALHPLVAELQASPAYRNTFDTLPMTVEMVELDKLVVSQTHVTCSFSEGKARNLGPRPEPAALFRYCQPLAPDLPPVRIEKTEVEKFIFSCPSTDLRPHDPILLRGVQTAILDSIGPIAGAIALPIGFGSNFLAAIRSERRLVLHNGYHRAHALRSLGITHAPCLVETVTRKDELRVAATEKVSSDPEFYFRGVRPPILKDFFDPRLTRRFPLRPRRTVVEVEFTMRKTCYIEPDPL